VEKPSKKGACDMKKEKDNFSEPSELQKGMIRGEVERLAYDHVLVENERYVVVSGWAGQIPSTLYEVGRLRKLAFREAGKSTGRKVDIDQFDLYYLHILIWGKETQEIVGACRIGQVDIILKRYGQEGLYTGHLSALIPAFVGHEMHTLEISKAFVREEYRRQVAPISLLCRGIGKFMLHNPHYRGIIGFISHGGSTLKVSKRSKERQASGKVHAGRKGMSGLLRLGGTLGEDSVLAFTDLTEARAGLRYCMGKTASEQFTEYHQPRHDRAA
jgi:hypothetical protein